MEMTIVQPYQIFEYGTSMIIYTRTNSKGFHCEECRHQWTANCAGRIKCQMKKQGDKPSNNIDHSLFN